MMHVVEFFGYTTDIYIQIPGIMISCSFLKQFKSVYRVFTL